MPTLMDDDWDMDGKGEVLMPYQDWDMERDVDDLDDEFGLLGPGKDGLGMMWGKHEPT